MSDFLLELMCEELPPLAQSTVRTFLENAFRSWKVNDGKKMGIDAFHDEAIRSLTKTQDEKKDAAVESFFWTTPRRLAILVCNVPTKTSARTEEKRGPRVESSDQSVERFLSSHGAQRSELFRDKDKKNNHEYWFIKKKNTVQTFDRVLFHFFYNAFFKVPFKKVMRWKEDQTLLWPRPIRSFLCLFDNTVCSDFFLDGLENAGVTYGRRFSHPEDDISDDVTIIDCPKNYEKKFMGPPVIIDHPKNYKERLKDAFVIVDHDERELTINKMLNNEKGVFDVDNFDKDLLSEVSAMVEYPVVYKGRIADKFLSLPSRILKTSMRLHQRYFPLEVKKRGVLVSSSLSFLFVSQPTVNKNSATSIIKGNERVLEARFTDAAFAWKDDTSIPIEQRIPHLKEIVFHEKIGTLSDKVERMKNLYHYLFKDNDIYKDIYKDSEKHISTIELLKVDLLCKTVNEFPELQGYIGAEIAEKEELGEIIVSGIREHYRPLGKEAMIPQTLSGVIMALLDKCDTLFSFWKIGQRPTGSKDPFALRRFSLGIIRILLISNLEIVRDFDLLKPIEFYLSNDEIKKRDIIDFFKERLQVYFKEHERIDKLFVTNVLEKDQWCKEHFNIRDIYLKSASLQKFCESEDGRSFLTACKRLFNILRSEEETWSMSKDLEDGIYYSEEMPYYIKNLIEFCYDNNIKIVTTAENSAKYRKLSNEDVYKDFFTIMKDVGVGLTIFLDEIHINDSSNMEREFFLSLLYEVSAKMSTVFNFDNLADKRGGTLSLGMIIIEQFDGN